MLTMETLVNIAQRIIDLLSIPVPVNNELLTIGASIGIALHEPNKSESMELLMQRADKALYEAKSSGRNTYSIDGDDQEAAKNIFLIHHKNSSDSKITAQNNDRKEDK